MEQTSIPFKGKDMLGLGSNVELIPHLKPYCPRGQYEFGLDGYYQKLVREWTGVRFRTSFGL